MPRKCRRRFQIRLTRKGARAFMALSGMALGLVTASVLIWGRGAPLSAGLPEPTRGVQSIDKLSSIEGWVPAWTDEAAIVRDAAAAGFNGVLLFHGTVKADGTVTLEDEAGLRAGVSAARDSGVALWLTVTNHGADMTGALGKGRTGAHVTSLLAAWRASGCGHLDLDYETLTLAQLRGLEDAVDAIADGLGADSRLSLTLQPSDSALRPDQLPVYRRLLANPRVACVRLMAYDYHWRNSLPGALCPLPAFRRLIEAYPEYRSKLVMCLPLYGYDWPRPNDTTLPAAQSVALRDLEKLRGAKAAWMADDAELALEYTDGVKHMVAAPSLRAVRARVQAMLELGVPNVCFWHLGCARAQPVAQACREPGKDQPEVFTPREESSWRDWQTEFKQRSCTKVVARPGDTLESIGRAHGIERALMYRFNEDLTNDGLAGRTVFVPR